MSDMNTPLDFYLNEPSFLHNTVLEQYVSHSVYSEDALCMYTFG